MKKILGASFVVVLLLTLCTIIVSANGSVEVFTDQATFVSQTGADMIPFPSSADSAFPNKPFASHLTDYSCTDNSTGITLGTGDVIVKAPLANGWICFIGPGWNAGLPNTNPTPTSPTIVANGEDDYHVVQFERPVYAIGFRLLTNSFASETITVHFSDASTTVFDDSQLGTEPNAFEFVGFRSTKPVTSVEINTTGGGTQNEGIVAIWVNDEAMTRDINDCSHLTYTGYSYIETLFVSAFGSGVNTPVVSSTSLVSGQTHIIEASGVYYAGGTTTFDIRADAEYSQDAYQRAHDEGWTDLVRNYGSYGEGLLELMLDSNIVEWGDFSGDHIYSLEWLGTGSPLTIDFQIYDIYAQNNTGGLCVSIFYCDPSVIWLPPITLPDWTLNENATLPIKFQLQDCNGEILTTDLSPILTVDLPGELTELRFDPEEFHYIANFKPTNSGLHTAIVSLNGVDLGDKEFTVMEPGKGNGKGKGSDD